MNARMIAVATIRLDRPDRRRGCIRIGQTTEGWEVDCLTPDNIIEPASLPAFPAREQALDAIQASWGHGPWDLRWIG